MMKKKEEEEEEKKKKKKKKKKKMVVVVVMMMRIRFMIMITQQRLLRIKIMIRRECYTTAHTENSDLCHCLGCTTLTENVLHEYSELFTGK